MSIVSQTTRKTRAMRLESVPPEEAIPYLLKSLHHSLRQAVEELFRRERIEMSFAHLATLYTLDSEPGVAGAELARRVFIAAQSMNTILRRLEQDGDIERRPNPANARADSWYVTKAGQQRLKRARLIGDAVWRRMLSTLKAAEVAQLQRLLEQCIGGLDAQLKDMKVRSKSKGNPAGKRAARGRGRR